MRTFIEVPFSSTTLNVTPAPGSLTLLLGVLAFQYDFVSSNSGWAFCPRMSRPDR